MSLLRIYGILPEVPQRCQWALLDHGREPVVGEGRFADLPRGAERVQLVIPAAQVLITHARVPSAARRGDGSVLAFAVEDRTAGEPDGNQVSWLGAVGEDDVLAVVDKTGMMRWRVALEAVGVRGYEVHCETLMLPWTAGEWSLAWNGREGFLRTGECDGAATDCGDHYAPPLSLRLMLEEAQASRAGPSSIVLRTIGDSAAPDIAAWTRELGIAVSVAGIWDWRTAVPDAGTRLTQERQPWRLFAGLAVRLRPAAWVLGAALAIQGIALAIDWTSLASEQRVLRRQMETRFRATFPDAVAVSDPALQMRRKLAEARHATGQPDNGDFLPMIEKVMMGVQDLPAGALRVVSYDGGRVTLELAVNDEAAVQRVVARFAQSGLSIEPYAALKRTAGATVVITVRAS